MHITASKLYDYTQCPHRVWRDVYGPQDEKSKEVNSFVQMLWDRGVSYEQERMLLAGDYLEISRGSLDERFEKTMQAMKEGAPLIYQGVLQKDNLLGIPDLLRKDGDGRYVPIDIKSGMGYESANGNGEGELKLKKHYAVQLALYSDLLQRLGFENKRKGIILDIKGNEIEYNLDESMGARTPMTFWEFYEQTSGTVSSLIEGKIKNKPASAGACKLCQWHDSCKKWVKENDDLTGIFYVGRSARDTIANDLHVSSIDDVLSVDISEAMSVKKKDKTFLKGVGESALRKIIRRAKILKETKKPVAHEEIEFPKKKYELFFDIEADPTREFVYMHGVYERSENGERYIDFTAREISDEEEKRVWAEFWEYIRSLPKDDFVVYYYSPYERVTYGKMRKKYPDVVSEEELENFFDPDNAVDLYTDVVLKKTDWPLGSYSIKAIAVYLGFEWEDESPSGALSIDWFNQYVATKDKKIMERILIYNKDDCKATMILKDGLEKLGKGEL